MDFRPRSRMKMGVRLDATPPPEGEGTIETPSATEGVSRFRVYYSVNRDGIGVKSTSGLGDFR